MRKSNEPRDLVAFADQNEAGMRDIARVHAAYYKGLLKEGIPLPVAVELTKGMIFTLHHQPSREDDGE